MNGYILKIQFNCHNCVIVETYHTHILYPSQDSESITNNIFASWKQWKIAWVEWDSWNIKNVWFGAKYIVFYDADTNNSSTLYDIYGTR